MIFSTDSSGHMGSDNGITTIGNRLLINPEMSRGVGDGGTGDQRLLMSKRTHGRWCGVVVLRRTGVSVM